MMRLVLFCVLGGFVSATFAGDKGESPSPAPSTPTSADAVAEAAAEASASALTDVALNASHRSLYIGGSTAPIPIAPEGECWKPKKGFGRGQRILFGLFEISALAEFDETVCDKLTEYERAKAARIRLELELARELKK